ncbi:MAG: M20 family metallopeptidase [Lentisphaerae bacterium]|nr:M20 family metallopeptidase [Lentisphaerota bacterium]
MLSFLVDEIAGIKGDLRKLSDDIWNNPELAYQEHFASTQAKNLLENLGYSVKKPCFGLDTAFTAEYGSGTPVFAIFAEYDALPEIGHGCGHNLICAAAIAAFHAAARAISEKKLSGKVVLLGSPAEESGGGKVRMIENGCLQSVDAAMMVHPSFRAIPDTGSTAISRFDVIFHGKASHAAGAPELGVNALAAVNLLFAGVNAYREQTPENVRMHGIITCGGEAPNITPDLASCRFFLRSTDQKWMEKIEKRFLDIVRGAELMTGATAEVKPFNIPYKARRPNDALNRNFLEGITKLGVKYIIPATGGRGSSDFGNVSQLIPGIHPYFPVADHEIPGHSQLFRDACGTDFAFGNAMTAAAAMADTAVKYITDANFKAEVDAGIAK